MSDQIMRRNPRLLRIARNRLHPQHQQIVLAGMGKVFGPTGLLRRNVHGLGVIGPSGLKRIDRSMDGSMAYPALDSPASAPRRPALSREPSRRAYQVASPEVFVVVVPEMSGGRLTSHDLDLLGQAQRMSQSLAQPSAVLAVVFGEHREERFNAAGVDRVLHVSGAEYQGYVPERKVALLQALDEQLTAKFWLFPDGCGEAAELGRRFSARIGVRPATQVWRADVERCTGRGAAGLIDIERSTPKVLLMQAECALPIDETLHQALPISLDLPINLEQTVLVNPQIRDLGFIDIDPSTVALGEAEFIFAAGNGVDDWALFHATAQALGATEGASRVVVDDGHMPRERQVGATGTWVTARVYVAVGISGAVQHLQGIAGCDQVIAINTDVGCDMVKRAALSVIADSGEVMRELVALVDAYRKQEARYAA